jgi:hypothetical protein
MVGLRLCTPSREAVKFLHSFTNIKSGSTSQLWISITSDYAGAPVWLWRHVQCKMLNMCLKRYRFLSN